MCNAWAILNNSNTSASMDDIINLLHLECAKLSLVTRLLDPTSSKVSCTLSKCNHADRSDFITTKACRSALLLSLLYCFCSHFEENGKANIFTPAVWCRQHQGCMFCGKNLPTNAKRSVNILDLTKTGIFSFFVIFVLNLLALDKQVRCWLCTSCLLVAKCPPWRTLLTVDGHNEKGLGPNDLQSKRLWNF
jgi:hypothetical protein